jgi:hypothetical protein
MNVRAFETVQMATGQMPKPEGPKKAKKVGGSLRRIVRG